MWRVRLRPKAAYHQFPGMGYALAMAACGGLVLAGVLHWEWGIFVLWPALNGACHFPAPREVRGGRAYWTLAAMWCIVVPAVSGKRFVGHGCVIVVRRLRDQHSKMAMRGGS